MKNKKLIFTALTGFFIILALFLTPYSASANQASLSLSPISGGPFKVGATFNINIWAKTGGANIDTIRASLNFPANLLEAQSVSLGSVYNAPSGGNYINNNNGTIYWGAGAYGGTTADATFATIIFKAKAAGTATISFASNSLMLSAGQAVPYLTANGAYTIESGALAPTPAPAVKPQLPQFPAPVAPYLPAPSSITNTITGVTETPQGIPTFSGNASIGGAKISFNIENGLLVKEVIANERGNWQWTVSEKLAPGSYSLEITAVHPQDSSITAKESTRFDIAITEALEPLFDVILGVKKESKKILPGSNLKIDMKLINFGENIKEQTVTNIELTYRIENSNREEVLRKTEKRQVIGRESSFAKELAIPKDLKPGQYFISAKMTYGDKQEASSSDTFEIKNDFWEKNNINIIILVIAIAVIMIIIIISSIWKKETKPPHRRPR